MLNIQWKIGNLQALVSCAPCVAASQLNSTSVISGDHPFIQCFLSCCGLSVLILNDCYYFYYYYYYLEGNKNFLEQFLAALLSLCARNISALFGLLILICCHCDAYYLKHTWAQSQPCGRKASWKGHLRCTTLAVILDAWSYFQRSCQCWSCKKWWQLEKARWREWISRATFSTVSAPDG